MSYKRPNEEKTYMALSQYGDTFHDLGPHPRKALMERLDRQHVQKMYQDRNGKAFHIGYIIGGLWLRVYEVRDFARSF